MENNIFKPCGNCNDGYLFRRDRDDTIAILCSCRKLFDKINDLRLNIIKSNLPNYILEYNIDDYIGEDSIDNIIKLETYIKNFEKDFYNKHLYLWSIQNSTQKTTIASWVGSELIKKGISVYFILMDTLIKLLQMTDFNFDNKNDDVEEAKEIIEKCYNSDFLIIDDSFDVYKVTLYKSKYQIPFLDSFLRKRLENSCRATCFTSNLPINNIGKDFGFHIENLIKRNIIEPLEFKDSIYTKTKETMKW